MNCYRTISPNSPYAEHIAGSGSGSPPRAEKEGAILYKNERALQQLCPSELFKGNV